MLARCLASESSWRHASAIFAGLCGGTTRPASPVASLTPPTSVATVGLPDGHRLDERVGKPLRDARQQDDVPSVEGLDDRCPPDPRRWRSPASRANPAARRTARGRTGSRRKRLRRSGASRTAAPRAPWQRNGSGFRRPSAGRSCPARPASGSPAPLRWQRSWRCRHRCRSGEYAPTQPRSSPAIAGCTRCPGR